MPTPVECSGAKITRPSPVVTAPWNLLSASRPTVALMSNEAKVLVRALKMPTPSAQCGANTTRSPLMAEAPEYHQR